MTKRRPAPKPTEFSELYLNSDAMFADPLGVGRTSAVSLRLGVVVGSITIVAALLHGESVVVRLKVAHA